MLWVQMIREAGSVYTVVEIPMISSTHGSLAMCKETKEHRRMWQIYKLMLVTSAIIQIGHVAKFELKLVYLL